ARFGRPGAFRRGGGPPDHSHFAACGDRFVANHPCLVDTSGLRVQAHEREPDRERMLLPVDGLLELLLTELDRPQNRSGAASQAQRMPSAEASLVPSVIAPPGDLDATRG